MSVRAPVRAPAPALPCSLTNDTIRCCATLAKSASAVGARQATPYDTRPGQLDSKLFSHTIHVHLGQRCLHQLNPCAISSAKWFKSA